MSLLSLADAERQSSFLAVADIAALALDAIPIAVYVVDRTGRIVRFNARAAELWGRVPAIGDAEELYCGARRLYWRDGRPLPHAETPMAQVLKTGEPCHGAEVQIERDDGSRSIVLVNIDPLHDESGRLAGAINCFQDVTEQKRLEEELLRSQAFLRAVIDTTPDCIKLVAPDGALMRMNSAGLGMIGAPDFAAVNGTRTVDMVAPEHRDAWCGHHERVLGGERQTWEFDLVGLDGQRRHMESHAAPLVMPDGGVAHLAVTRDVSRRKHDQAALVDVARLHSDILQALPVAVYTTDPDGLITFYNEAAVEFAGRRPQLGSDAWCVSYRLFRPGGTPLPHDQCPMAVALREQRPSHGESEAVAERPDGTRVPFLPFITPLFDAAGTLIGAVNMLVDISERKRAEDRQKVFADELNHRVRNTLSVVHALAAQTARRSSSVADFAASFEARVGALAKAHDLVARTAWEQADLVDVASQVLKPYRNVTVDGPAVALAPARALALALVVNELAINASKHGALTLDSGKVSMSWQVTDEDGKQVLDLDWRETGGPRVATPAPPGFGALLVDRTVTRDLAGRVDRDFRPDGLCCHIRFPLPVSARPGSWPVHAP